jgi:GAF domain-containing protein
MVAYICIPVFTGVAILRHRLYDIDLFLNRAITLAALTGFVTLGYIAVVVLIGTLAPLTQDAFWPSLLATAVVALAFQPVRKRAERLADRLVYGARAAPYIELAEFSRRLQESPGPQSLLQQVSEAVARAVGAHAVAIRVDVPGAPPEQASWPEDVSPSRAPGRVLPVVEGDERLGELAVAMPPGTDLRPEEERLLSDFAVQLGRAFRNMRLESALLARVEQLQASTVALEESARRLTMAQEAERARFESNLARTVVPHLHRVREGVRRLRDELPCPPETGPSATGRPVEPLDPAPGERVAQQIDEMTEHTQTALESLRTLTRRVFPMQLARHGLGPALSAHLRGRDAAALEADPSADRRFEPYVESAAYFCAVEILRELDGPVTLRLAAVGDLLALEVVARGPVPAAHAIGHLHDRAAALGGQVLVTEADGEIRFRLELPLSSAAEPVPDLSQPV